MCNILIFFGSLYASSRGLDFGIINVSVSELFVEFLFIYFINIVI